MRIRTLCAAVVMAVASVAAPASAAPFRVEAEARSRDAGFCASDGERVGTHPWAGTSGQAILFLPHDRCWAEWTVDTPIRAITLNVLRPNGTGSGLRECHIFDVVIDGLAAGSSGAQCGGPNDPQIFQDIPLVEGLNVGQGSHTLRLTMRITQGPSWGNGYLDYLTITGSPDGSPSEPLDVAARWHLANRRVGVEWDAPASPGNAPVTGYRVYRAEGTSFEVVAELGDIESYADGDVLPGHTYTYAVTAVNDIGEGIESSPATVHVPGGTLFDAAIPVGPSEEVKIVTLAGRSEGSLYCISAAVRSAQPSDLACVNVFGVPIPDAGPVTVAVPAGTTATLEARYFYDPSHVRTGATLADGTVLLMLPAEPDDADWLGEHAPEVSLDITVGPATLTIPALGQVLGALHESAVAGQPVVK